MGVISRPGVQNGMLPKMRTGTWGWEDGGRAWQSFVRSGRGGRSRISRRKVSGATASASGGGALGEER